jgi:hypothetical protein
VCNYELAQRAGKLHESPFTGKRWYAYQGDHAKYTLNVHRPAGMSLGAWNSHYAYIQSLLKEGATVAFYRHADLTEHLNCYVTELKPYYHNNAFVKDAYQLVLVSVDYVTEPAVSQVAEPVATPAGGDFTTSRTVSLSCATSGAEIHYTIDGSTPTLSSPIYLISLVFSVSTTLKARAYKDGLIKSDIMHEVYNKIGA